MSDCVLLNKRTSLPFVYIPEADPAKIALVPKTLFMFAYTVYAHLLGNYIELQRFQDVSDSTMLHKTILQQQKPMPLSPV